MLCEVFIVTEQKKVTNQDTLQTHGGRISWASDSKARKWSYRLQGCLVAFPAFGLLGISGV